MLRVITHGLTSKAIDITMQPIINVILLPNLSIISISIIVQPIFSVLSIPLIIRLNFRSIPKWIKMVGR